MAGGGRRGHGAGTPKEARGARWGAGGGPGSSLTGRLGPPACRRGRQRRARPGPQYPRKQGPGSLRGGARGPGLLVAVVLNGFRTPSLIRPLNLNGTSAPTHRDSQPPGPSDCSPPTTAVPVAAWHLGPPRACPLLHAPLHALARHDRPKYRINGSTNHFKAACHRDQLSKRAGRREISTGNFFSQALLPSLTCQHRACGRGPPALRRCRAFGSHAAAAGDAQARRNRTKQASATADSSAVQKWTRRRVHTA
jgi:hypothetical protein